VEARQLANRPDSRGLALETIDWDVIFRTGFSGP
jgi:hypothetical protein